MAKKQIARTSKALTSVLFEELDALKNGTSTPQQARAKSSIANSIIAVARLEMEYARFVTTDRAPEGTLQAITMS